MTPELSHLLYERHPVFFRRRTQTPRETLMCYGCCHSDGWAGILDTLCGVLEAHAAKLGKPVIEGEQVKEKFARLTVYTTKQDAFEAAAVRLAGDVSQRVCEVCGRPGRPCMRPGRTRTVCVDHMPDEGFEPRDLSPMRIPYLGADLVEGINRRHAGILRGVVSVPSGWLDLTDCLLDYLGGYGGEPRCTVPFAMEEGGGLWMAVDGASSGKGEDAVRGALAFAEALSRRIDPVTGAVAIPSSR